MPSILGRQVDSPYLVEFGHIRRVGDVLVPGELVGQATHIGTALDIVLTANRHQSGTVTADVPSEQRQVDQREDVVGGVVMLGDPQRPAQLGATGSGVIVGQLPDHRRRHPGYLLRLCQRVRLDRSRVFLVAAGRMGNESLVDQTSMDDLPAEGVRQGDIGANIDSQPDVGELSRSGAPRVDGVHFGAVANPFEEMMEEDWMGFARV